MLPREFEINNKKLIIHQNLDYKYAGEIWDAAIVFSYFLINDKSKKVLDIKGKTIIELGAGTGVLGLIMGMLGAKKVIMTDKEIRQIKENYDENKKILPKDFECQIGELDWLKESDLEEVKDGIDYIIGSDIVWNPMLREPLFKVIDFLMGSKNTTEAFFSFEIRDREISKFFELFKKNKYIIERLPKQYYDDEYYSEDIIIVRIKKI